MVEKNWRYSFESQKDVVQGKNNFQVIIFEFNHQLNHTFDQVPHFVFVNVLPIGDQAFQGKIEVLSVGKNFLVLDTDIWFVVLF